MDTPVREPQGHESSEDIAMVNAVFVADQLLLHLARLDFAQASPVDLAGMVAALSQLAQAEAATRQAIALERIAAALEAYWQ